MRRVLVVAASATAMIGLTAAPALAQSAGSSGRQSALILGSAIGAGVALFLFIVILFGSNAGVERDLRGRLGALSGEAEDRGRLARIPLLRRFVTGAEDIARDRGFINQIETALDQANLPLRPGEAIAGIIGIAGIAGLLAMVFSQNAIWGAIAAAAVLGVVALAAADQVAARFAAEGVVALVAEDVVGPVGTDQRVVAFVADHRRRRGDRRERHQRHQAHQERRAAVPELPHRVLLRS